MISFLQVIDRALTGPISLEKDFDLEIFNKELNEVVRRYDIKYDPQNPVPADDDLADRVWEAAMEFLVETGVYCLDTERRILFTLAMLAVYRVGCHIPTPGIDGAALAAFFSARQGTLFGLFDMFSGGALSQMSVMALGIMPYISASIILELLTVVIPYLEKLKKEGEQGRKKITQYTRYGTVVLSFVQGFGIAVELFPGNGKGLVIALMIFGHVKISFHYFSSRI